MHITKSLAGVQHEMQENNMSDSDPALRVKYLH